MQTHEDIKRARRPERPAQVTAKKETVLSPEPVHNFKDHREIIARKRRKANRRREVFLARLAAGAALVFVVTVTVSLVSCSKKKEPVNAPATETTETPQETTLIPEYKLIHNRPHIQRHGGKITPAAMRGTNEAEDGPKPVKIQRGAHNEQIKPGLSDS